VEVDGVRIGEFVRTNNKSQEALWCVREPAMYSCWPRGDGRQMTSSLEAHDTGHHAKLLL